MLILDEPANGLDPAGIRWMRGLLKGFADRGGTVLLSSHLLHEVEMIADEMILIGHGRVLAQGDKKQLLASQGQQTVTSSVLSLDDAALGEELRRRGHQVTPGVAGSPAGLTVVAEAAEVGRAALAAGVVLTDLRSVEQGLEDLFLDLTAAAARERPGVPPGPAAPPYPNPGFPQGFQPGSPTGPPPPPYGGPPPGAVPPPPAYDPNQQGGAR